MDRVRAPDRTPYRTRDPVRLRAGSRFLGIGPAAAAVRRFIGRAARVDSTVILTGDSGVGKELVAREIHERSRRLAAPFVPVNCGAIPETLIEAELFGHEPGAYTDAREVRRGAFELADRGTLFLDEVSDLSRAAQPKLLRVLETSEITRLGSERSRRVDIRVVSATNRDLKKMCGRGRFRIDLFYRLCVLEMRIPPLRERLEDIPVLVDHFAVSLSRRAGRDRPTITQDAMDLLGRYSWPGNVRELKHVVERAIAMNSSSRLDRSCFDLEPVGVPGSLRGLLEREWRNAREEFESAYARHQLERHKGNVKAAARAAGVATGSFYRMLRRLRLRPGPHTF